MSRIIGAFLHHTSRVVSKFLSNIDDAIDALLLIIENKNGVADNEIFNIGNPTNHMNIKDLADTLVALAKKYPKYQDNAEKTQIVSISGVELYGKGYQNVPFRVPSIKRVQEKLGWQPSTTMQTALKKTVDFYLSD